MRDYIPGLNIPFERTSGVIDWGLLNKIFFQKYQMEEVRMLGSDDVMELVPSFQIYSSEGVVLNKMPLYDGAGLCMANIVGSMHYITLKLESPKKALFRCGVINLLRSRIDKNMWKDENVWVTIDNECLCCCRTKTIENVVVSNNDLSLQGVVLEIISASEYSEYSAYSLGMIY